MANIQCPSEEKLRILVANGADCIPIAQELISRFKLPFIVEKIGETYELRSAYTRGEQWLMKFVTVDPKTLLMKEDAAKMAKCDYDVLIYGKTGTGKELIAKSQIGSREGSIMSVNCAGLPHELIESELFGYVQGAFTGANKTTDGLITLAADGVMFLDEIGELPMDVQGKLLRVLQEKTVRKVGGKVFEKVTCKFVCASNRDLKSMVKSGQFREDLYARISVLELNIESLDERKCDIVPIMKTVDGGLKFLEKYERELLDGMFDLSLNVRSLQKLAIRYSVLGRVA